MKKVLFVLVLMLVASTCFAQLQSGPSNVVGYVKVDATGGNQFTAFGLPFMFWDVDPNGVPIYNSESTKPSDIIGDQTFCNTLSTNSDRIVRQAGNFGWRHCTNGWQGTLETNSEMTPGRGYWVLHRPAGTIPVVLAGEVVNSGNYLVLTVPGGGNFTALSFRDSRSRARDVLGLRTANEPGESGGFTGGTLSTNSDRLVQQGGDFAWYNTNTNVWAGLLLTAEPGKAFWILNRHAQFVYNYDGGANDGLLIADDQKASDNSGTISKVTEKSTVKAAKGAAR